MGGIAAISLLLFVASALPYIAIANYISLSLGFSGLLPTGIIFLIVEMVGLAILRIFFKNFTVAIILFFVIGAIIVFSMGDNIYQYLPKDMFE